MSKNSINRRDFLSNVAVMGAAGTMGAGALLTSCGDGRKASVLTPLRPESEWTIPQGGLPDKAKDGTPLRAGVIGCGNRGTGAAQNFLDAGPNLSIVALGDLFPEGPASCRKMLKEKYNQDIPEDKCFTGFDNYKKVIDSGVDVVIVASPPAFRPAEFKYAVNAGKHVFLEKPLAVDPVGVRSVIADSRKALSQGLSVVTGTHCRHQRSYIESYKQIQSGLIGKITAGYVYNNATAAWHKTKDPKWTDMEWMIRDWINLTWLSGDLIVEGHIHSLDRFNWFMEKRPLKATGNGARHRRLTGDQFDMFSVDYTYEGDIHLQSMSRNINGCSNLGYDLIKGTEGSWNSNHRIVDLNGNVIWQYDFEKEKADFRQVSPYVLEHVEWVNYIRDKKAISQAEETALSTLTAIMGRVSAYTGVDVTWDEMMASDLSLVPENPELKDMDMSQYVVPVPGKD